MRDLNVMERDAVSGGNDTRDVPVGASRWELEIQMQQLMQLLEEQAQRNAHKGR